jgi:predicted metal-dependent phosphoesterase TrpH
MLQGVLHIHSTYSDGEFSLPELRELFTASGVRFACVTDHADAFDDDDERRAQYRSECEALSSDSFRFVPGLEYSCADRMHILGYGVTDAIASADPEEVIAAIRRLGGVAVVAHPKDAAFARIERFNPLPDGIEVWNSKYDGRYAPRPGTFELLARARTRRADIRAFYGQDLHWRRQYRGLTVEVDAAANDGGVILAALAGGRFCGVRDGRQRLPADGVLPAAVLEQFARAQRRSQTLRRCLGRAKGWVDSLGVAVPSPVKAQLRRIF